MTLEEESNIRAASAAPLPGAVRELGKTAAIRVVEERAGPVTVVVTGELDLSCVNPLITELCDAVEAHPAGLRLDLGGVDFCGCCMVRAFLTVRAYAIAVGRGFAIGPHSQAVARVLELSETRSLLTTPE